MRHRSFIILASLLLLLIVGAVGVYAYDASNDGKIAQGVTIAGIDVGGLNAAQARKAVAARVEEPLQKAIEVRWAGRSYRLTAKQTGVRADIDAMIADAIAKGRDGSIISRTERSLTGGKVNANIPARISYRQDAVDKLILRVKRHVTRRPTDATVAFSGVGIKKVPGKTGVELRDDDLRAAVRDELEHPTADRIVKARVTKTKPKVGIHDLASKYPVVVAVSRGEFKLRLFQHLKLTRTYPIAVGQVGLETPAGLYHVQNKAVNPAWSVPKSPWAGKLGGTVVPGGVPANPLKARWLGIYNGAGIHGTDAIGSLGSAASHGCIRMAVPDVIALYDKVPMGAPVYIA